MDEIGLDASAPNMHTTRVVVVGIDPGPTSCGWGILQRIYPSARPRVVAVGCAPSEPLALSTHLRSACCRGFYGVTIAIESVKGYAFTHQRSKALNETAHVAGLIEGIASSWGVPIVKVSAAEWRRHLVGCTNPSDATIKCALSILVDGLPKRTNAHHRDALGAAFFSLRTDPVRAALGAK